MKLFLRYLISLISLISIIFITVPHFTYAATQHSTDLANLLDSVRTMSADFSQTIYDESGKAVQHSYGHMALQRPGKFRWQVTKPIAQLIIANQSRLWIYDPDLEQVTIRSLSKTTGETPALLLSHENTILDKDFTVSLTQNNLPGWQWFTLIPKRSDNMFASVRMGFVNGQIHEMRLKDHLGHSTVVQYQNIQTNINLTPALFIFKPPKHVDVINETRKG
jgi:outer membrane lipoprotein carrier protein